MSQPTSDYDRGVAKLEGELAHARRNGARATRELAALKATRTWKARRTVAAATARLRRPRR